MNAFWQIVSSKMAGTEQAEKNSNVELKLNALRILAFESDGSFSEISLRLEEIVQEYSRNVDELFTQLLRLTEIFRHPNGASTQSSSKKDLQSATVQSPLSRSKELVATPEYLKIYCNLPPMMKLFNLTTLMSFKTVPLILQVA